MFNKVISFKAFHISNRSFSKQFLLLVLAFIFFHFAIWNFYTKEIFNLPKNRIIGDLGRLSYATNSLMLRSEPHPIFFNMNNWDRKPVDLLTIGDSFSNGGGTYYQNHLIKNQHLRILNIPNLTNVNNYIETISILNQTNFLNIINPKSILIESVERRAVERFSANIDFNKTVDNVNKLLEHNMNSYDTPATLSFINTNNYNAFLYNILYFFNDSAFYSSVYKVSLTGAHFNNKAPSTLLYYINDLKYLNFATKSNISALNHNINTLAKALQEKKITLYFMPVVDKYDLYEPYIINNQYQQSHFFKLLRQEDKQYTLIDTKKILSLSLNNKEKDIFWADDSHWTEKAVTEIFSEYKFQKHEK